MLVAHADRQPRRPLAARGRGAPRRRRDRRRGHPPDPRAAHARRRPGRRAGCARCTRTTSARGARRIVDAVRDGSARRATSPTPGMPGISDPGRAPRARVPRRRARGRGRARAERGAHRARAVGLPDRPLRVRGLPARAGARARRERIAALAAEARTIVLFEAPQPRARDARRPARPRAGRCARSRSPASSRSCYEEVWRGDARRSASDTSELDRATRRARDRARARAAAARGRATTRSTRTSRAALDRGPVDPRRRRPRRPRPRRAASPRLRRRHAPQAARRSRRASLDARYGRATHSGNRVVTPMPPTPFYVTTPIYYVNDVPHIGHAYTTVAADVAGPVAAALGRRRRVPHRHRRARRSRSSGPPRPTASRPQEWADRDERAVPGRAGRLLDITNTDFIRTTEPRHREAVQEFLQGVYDNGDIELGTYEGLYCVALRGLLHRGRAGRRATARSTARPVERVTEENYFFQLSRYEDRLLDHYADASRGGAARRHAQRGARASSSRASLDFSMSRTSISWGIPLPWDPTHVAYVWFDALINYCTAVGYGDDRERFDRYWPATTTSSARTSSASHAVYWPAMLMAAGEAPPKRVFAHGFLLVGGEKMSKTAPEPDRARRSRRRVRRRRLPLPLPRATSASGPTATSATRRWSRATTPTSPTTSATSPTACSTWRSNYCDGVVARRARGRPAASSRRRAAFDGADATAWTQLDFSSGFGAVWELIRARELVHRGPAAVGAAQGGRHGRGRGGARRLPRGAADRRAPRVAADPARVGRAVAPPRPRRRAGGRSACPTPRRGAASPAGAPLEKGDAALPPHRDRRRRRWVDSHCHLPVATAPRPTPTTDAATGPATAGVERDGLRRHRPRRPRGAAVELAGAPPRRLGDRRAPPPRRVHARRRVARSSRRWPATPARRRRSARPASTSTTAHSDRADAGGRVPRPDPARRTSSTARS